MGFMHAVNVAKTFTLRPSCYNHLKIHTKEEYFCPQNDCDYKCKSESTFKEHIKYYHLPKNC